MEESSKLEQVQKRARRAAKSTDVNEKITHLAQAVSALAEMVDELAKQRSSS